MKKQKKKAGGREERVGWKNSQGAAHISFSKQNVWFLFQLRPSALLPHLWVKPTVRSGANFPFLIKMHWMLKNGLHARLEIRNLWCNPAKYKSSCQRALENVQSKQTDLSHDSHGLPGPHRSQRSWRDQTSQYSILSIHSKSDTQSRSCSLTTT